MAGLTGKTISSAYKSLLRINDDTNGVDSTIENVTDGEGTASSLSLSDDVLLVKPQNDNTTLTFGVSDKDGNVKFHVDTTNDLVKAHGHSVTTQYANFTMAGGTVGSELANNHHALAFGAQSLAGTPSFGTGTDPATTFTTAEGAGTRADILVPCLWYVPDNISILGVTSIEGADTATGDTTRMHLMSYTFNSGSTSALTSGTLLAHNSDVTNSGSEQGYKSTFTVDSANVASGKVIMAFMRADSINSDYSATIFIKYILV